MPSSAPQSDREFSRAVFLASAIVTAVALGAATLFFLHRLILWLVLGCVLAELFSRMAARFGRRLPGPRGLHVALALLLVLGGIGGAVALVSVPLVDQADALADSLPRSVARVQGFLERVSSRGRKEPPRPLSEPLAKGPRNAPTTPEPRSEAAASARVREAVTERLPAVAATGVPLLLEFLDGAFDVLGVIFFAAFVAASPETHRSGLLRLFPPHLRPRVGEFLDDAGDALGGWLEAVGRGMTIVGFLVTAGLYLIGVDYWLFFGAFAATMELVPYAGPFLGLLGPFLTCVLAGEWQKALSVLLLYLGVQVLMTNLVTPYLVKRRTEIPPSLALASILGLGAAAGALGVVAAVPCVALVLAGVRTLARRESPLATAAGA